MRLLVYNIAYGTGSPKGAAGHILGAANYLRAPERYFSSIRGFVERRAKREEKKQHTRRK